MLSTPLRRLASLLLIAVPASLLPAQSRGKNDPIELEGEKFKGIYYWLDVPKTRRGELVPLVFALHGNGQDSRGHFQRMCQLSTRDLQVAVVAPQYQQGKKFGDPVHPEALAAFRQILDDVCREHPIDRSRMVLQGFSMGAIYSCQWAYAPAEGQPFPFRALFLNSSVMPPRGDAPRVPYLLWVGDQERKVAGRYDVLKSVRECFRLLLSQGHDAWYLEMEGKGHTVAPESLDLQRCYLAAMPSFAGLADAKESVPRPLADIHDRLLRGELRGVFGELEALAKGTSDTALSVKAAALKLQRTLPRELKKLAKDLTSGEPETCGFLRYDTLLGLEAQLADAAELQADVRELREKLERKKSFARELEARQAWRQALELFQKDAEQGRAAFGELASGKLAETEFGRRAAATVRGLEAL